MIHEIYSDLHGERCRVILLLSWGLMWLPWGYSRECRGQGLPRRSIRALRTLPSPPGVPRQRARGGGARGRMTREGGKREHSCPTEKRPKLDFCAFPQVSDLASACSTRKRSVVQSHYAPLSNQTLARCEGDLPSRCRSHLSDKHYGVQLGAHPKVAEGRELSHSAPVEVLVPTFPKASVAVRYEAHALSVGDEVELLEAEGKRLVEAGVLEAPKAARRRSKE